MPFAISPSQPQRPNVMAKRHAVASGHYWASQAGFQILEAGGNAIDAGVATGIALNVLESEMCVFGGVAPTMIYLAEQNKAISFSGVGAWPQRATSEYFHQHHAGKVPFGILYSVVPATPDIWLTALEKYGTMSFGEVAASAIRFARDGFPMYPLFREQLLDRAEIMRATQPTTAAVYLPGGKVPELGELFVQADLGSMLQFLADEESASKSKGRAEGIDAARRAFYRGDIARKIVRQQEELGGLLDADDLANHRARIEEPHRIRFGDMDVYGCGAWSQGPMVLETLGILKHFDLKGMGHNSADYIHTVIEALKLAAADRERYFGDPDFVDVPVETLLSDPYIARRAAEIVMETAAPGLPQHGTVDGHERREWTPDSSSTSTGPIPKAHIHSGKPAAPQLETSYLCAVDRQGNAFSSTPSDSNFSGHVVPGTGTICSSWGSRGYTDPWHPGSIGPGRRPRMSANPQIAIRPGKEVMAFGSPGNEVLGQAQVQIFLNRAVFGMDPQSALEQPRFASYSWPGSIVPHPYFPGRINVESRVPEAVGQDLLKRGHKVEWWPERKWLAGSPCMIVNDLESGIRYAAADHRRTAYAIGW
jgi:gamma-glutamyltranspeptidase/glutathione hydrolase